ncbi:hypothetical protein BH20VER3_BH20VER3_08640 [soil metagenome]
MFRLVLRFGVALAVLAGALPALTQAEDDAVRVTVMMNPDGSKTIYQTDNLNHRATATTTDANGKLKGKILYQLDADGRYQSAQVLAADGAVRFQTRYRYDEQGRLAEETQLGKNDSVRNKIVYSYDAVGHPVGYAIYDSGGRLLRRVTPKKPRGRAAPGK